MKRPRVLLADDHRLLREAFTQLLAPSCEVVGAVADGRALLAAAQELRPDVVVLDIAMPLLNGLDAARQLQAPDARGQGDLFDRERRPRPRGRGFSGRRLGILAQELRRLGTFPGHPGSAARAVLRHAAGHSRPGRLVPRRSQTREEAGRTRVRASAKCCNSWRKGTR